MDITQKICPCCGKILTLIPPSHEHLSQCMDVSENGVEFQILNLYRLFSYTHAPRGNSRYQPVTRKNIFKEYSMRATKYSVAINGSTGRDVAEDVLCSPTLRNLIKSGGNRLYRHGVKYQCAKCGNILAFDINPNRILIIIWTALIAAVEAAVVLGILASVGVIQLFWVPVPFFPAAIAFVFYLIHRFIARDTEKYYNNIVPITEWDALNTLPTHITASATLPRRFKRLGNVFTINLNGKNFALYITHTENNTLGLYICGTNNEQHELISLIKKLNTHQNIPLSFCGKLIGNAEIIQLYDLPVCTEKSPQKFSGYSHSEWRCTSCGYHNPLSASECRSCGKYK